MNPALEMAEDPRATAMDEERDDPERMVKDRLVALISRELNTRLKVAAARSRRTVSDIIAVALSEYLEKIEPELAKP